MWNNFLAHRYLLPAMAVLLTGCSFKLIYNQLDWLLPWYMDDLVSISTEQEALLDARLEPLLHWHKTDQLPVYAAFIGCIEQKAADGLDAEEIDFALSSIRLLSDQLLLEIYPPLSELLQQLSDEQVNELFNNLKQQNHEFQERYIETSEKRQRQRRAEEMTKNIERWTRELNDQQIERIELWADRYHLLGAAFLESRLQWQAQFRQILTHRDDLENTQAALKSLLVGRNPRFDQQDQAYYEQNLQLLKQLITDLDQSLSSYQRQRFLQKLEEYREDFKDLSSEIRLAGSYKEDDTTTSAFNCAL